MIQWRDSDNPDNVRLYDTLTLAKLVANTDDPELKLLIKSGYPVGIKANLA